MTTLHTQRLILRPLALSDAARFSALTSDPSVARMTAGIPCPNPPIAAEGWILLRQARASLGIEMFFAIDQPGVGLIGVAGATLRPQGGWEIGYWIGRPYWDRGFATEAVGGMLDIMRARRMGPIHAGHFTDNPASARVLEKLGFVATGDVHPTFSLARGAASPMRLMALHAPDRAAA